MRNTKNKPRPFRSGVQLAEALCEVANIMYLLDNRQQFLEGLISRLSTEKTLVDNKMAQAKK